MTHTVDLKLSRDLKRFGAVDIDACFNCGNCTAVCQLSEDRAQFPRRLVRYGQLGMRDRLLAAKEPWLCWNCRDCSDTCPRQARPSEYMEAVRRHTVASMDPTGISRLMYRSPAFLVGFTLALAALFAGLLLSAATTPASGSFDMFGFIPLELIHNLGIAVLVAVGLLAVISTARLVLHLSRTFAPTDEEMDAPAGQGGVAGRVVAAIREVLDEMVRQRRFRNCEIDASRPPHLRSWFVHYCIMWGFLGLGLATAFDFLFKTPGELVPLWYPSRLLGTVAGLALMYGASVTIVRRLRGNDQTQSRLLSPDWLFLGLLFVVGLTGFVLELAVYLPSLAGIGYGFFVVHVVLAMELLVLFPFTKFAHAVYRPLAYGLYIMGTRRPSTEAPAELPAAG
jgi:NAD-dependent dihydropyrimidine dehydrogenase PreA subunit